MSYNGFCYWYSADDASYQESKEKCDELNAELPIVKNEQDSTTLNEILNEIGCAYIWLGGARLNPTQNHME